MPGFQRSGEMAQAAGNGRADACLQHPVWIERKGFYIKKKKRKGRTSKRDETEHRKKKERKQEEETMKSKRRKRIIAVMLCMVLAFSTGISTIAEAEPEATPATVAAEPETKEARGTVGRGGCTDAGNTDATGNNVRTTDSGGASDS